MLQFDLNINLHCTSTSLDVPAVQILWKSTQQFWDSARRRIFTKNFKKPLSNEQFKMLKNSKNIVFAYIDHAKFKKASFNSNRDIGPNAKHPRRRRIRRRTPKQYLPPFFKNGPEVKRIFHSLWKYKHCSKLHTSIKLCMLTRRTVAKFNACKEDISLWTKYNTEINILNSLYDQHLIWWALKFGEC